MPPEVLDAPAPPAATFRPTRLIVAREIHGARAAVMLDCGHVADLPADCLTATRCGSCPRGVVAAPREGVAYA